MSKIKQTFLKSIAQASLKAAIKANGTASLFGVFQPKEPADLYKFVKK